MDFIEEDDEEEEEEDKEDEGKDEDLRPEDRIANCFRPLPLLLLELLLELPLLNEALASRKKDNILSISDLAD
jgi:hypothetical protein